MGGVKKKLSELLGSDTVTLTRAQCMPSLCKPWVLQEGLNGVLSGPDDIFHILGLSVSVNVTIEPVDCYVAEQTPYDAADWVVM